MNSTFNATPLLDALHRDLSGKRSVRDCLRFKSLPSAEVKDALEKIQLDQQGVQFSFMSVMGFLLQLKTDCQAAAKREQPLTETASSSSSLQCISKLATVTRFLQFLFETWLLQASENSRNQQNQEASPVISDADMTKTIAQILQGLTGMVCSIIERTDDDTADDEDLDEVYSGDASETFNVRHIVVYVCGSLIRLNHYIRFRPSLLSPLWKGISEIVTSLSGLPQALTMDGMTALLEYLKEGLVESVLRPCDSLVKQTGNSAGSDISRQQQLFGQKILTFLLGRLAVFLPLDPSCPVLPDVLAVMLVISGIRPFVEAQPTISSQAHVQTFLKTYQQLSDKIDRLINSFVTKKTENVEEGEATLSTEGQVEVLLRTEAPSWDCIQGYTHLVPSAFAIGKTNLLLNLLQNNMRMESSAVCVPSDVNSMLRICQELVFASLPACHELTIYQIASVSSTSTSSQILVTVVETLLYCEATAPSLAISAEPGRARFHQWLASWLKPPSNSAVLHPLSLESAFEIMILYTRALEKMDTLSCQSFLSLLVKLWSCPMICTPLRANLTSLLTRLLKGSDVSINTNLTKMIVPELVRIEYDIRPITKSKKRKLTDTKPSWVIEDLRLLCMMISRLALTGTTQLKGNPAFPDKITSLSNRSLGHVCFRVALATGAMGIDQDESEVFVLIDSFLKAWSASSNKEPSNGFLTLAELVVEHVRGCIKDDLGNAELIRLCGILSGVCRDQHRIGDNPRFTPLLSSVASVMADLAKFIHQGGPVDVLDSLGLVFHRLLSSKVDVLRSDALSAFVSFTLTIPQSLKIDLLPKALPKSMHAALKCRMTENLSALVGNVNVQEQHIRCSKHVHQLSARQHLSDVIMPPISSFNIPAGSFIISMPIQDGRNARVIFPPGPQSLNDIKLINGDDDASAPKIKIQRVVTQQDGSLKVYVTE
jgi:hypothetical protein